MKIIATIGTNTQTVATSRQAVMLPKKKTMKNPKVTAMLDVAVRIPRMEG